MATLNYSPKI